jgi:hypothetical protein
MGGHELKHAGQLPQFIVALGHGIQAGGVKGAFASTAVAAVVTWSTCSMYCLHFLVVVAQGGFGLFAIADRPADLPIHLVKGGDHFSQLISCVGSAGRQTLAHCRRRLRFRRPGPGRGAGSEWG